MAGYPTGRRGGRPDVQNRVLDRGPTMICADCGTSAPRSAGPTWLAVHIRDAHHLPHRVQCAPCGAQGVVTSLQEVRDWAWRHGTCGLPDLPELCSALTKKAAARRAAARSRRECPQQRVH